VALAAIGAVGESCLDLVAAEAVMPRNNMVIILGALADTVRTQDIEHLTGLLDTDVVWEGVHPGQRCDGRDQAMRVLGGFFASRELVFDAVEVIARGDAVVVGIRGPGFNGIPEDFETVGQVFQVFTLGDGLVVRWRAYLDREDALAAAGSGGSVPAPTA
jgi:ketosteroid isomerase-like protein